MTEVDKPVSPPNLSKSVPGGSIIVPLMGFPFMSVEKPFVTVPGYINEPFPVGSHHFSRNSPGVRLPNLS